MITVSLIGEQPIPNLLPLRYQPPQAVVLIHSDRTERAARRLERLLPRDCEPVYCPTSAYDIQVIRQDLVDCVEKRGWAASELTFNLTGGTKPMVLAAYMVAAAGGSPFLYLQSEGKRTRLYRYAFREGDVPQLVDQPLLPALITIDDYLQAYVEDYQLEGFAETDGGRFEQAVYDALQPVVDEIAAGARLMGALEVDLVVRCDNQVGIIEAKTGRGVKKGIDQLNTAGGQRYLGTYTQKILASDQQWNHTRSNLRELAEARRVTLIELPSFHGQGCLSKDDAQYLVQTVSNLLGRGDH